MSTIPQQRSSRDYLADRLESSTRHLIAAANEADRLGCTGLAEDLTQIWREVLRCSSSLSDPPGRYRPVTGRHGTGLRPIL